ncbi:MAG: NAD(P)/FAD-dependent oxidoreductase [Actinomycetales bacterium]|nr:NAD(P)/FAD-dependent oxidoreductase [Actinomycetales bacterium]
MVTAPSPPRGTERVDVAIVGGGHNALVAAAYLAAAGRRVVLLERSAEVGGAAVSEAPFEGLDARLSRYSYLVSLLPERIVRDLRLDLTLVRRRYSSYTPLPGTDRGLLVDTRDAAATAASFARLGADADAAAWGPWGEATGVAARALFPTLTEPLPTRAEAARRVGDEAIWRRLVEEPIGAAIERGFADDLVRGVVLTDALIGTFAPNVDPELAANRCFLYHVIGGGTGDWDVPVGGMGAVSGAMRRAALEAGAELRTGCEVTGLDPDGVVAWRAAEGGARSSSGDPVAAEGLLAADVVLAAVAPTELARLLGTAPPNPPVEGAQVKVNLLLERLPRLRDASVDPAAAFAGTFHVNEGWAALDRAHAAASAGRIPDPLPLEIYCHSLSDPTILGPVLRERGVHTLTVFGLHTPHRLAAGRDAESYRTELQAAVLASLDAVLAEPIESVVLRDAAGRPCLETRTTLDLEDTLRLPGGNIFHAPLEWPFLDEGAETATAAQRWGVATEHPRILLAAAGARRGGGVSGVGGHNAAMAVLEAG